MTSIATLGQRYETAGAQLAKAIEHRLRVKPATLTDLDPTTLRMLADADRDIIYPLQQLIADDRQFIRETTAGFFFHGSIAQLLGRQENETVARLHTDLVLLQEAVRDAQPAARDAMRLLRRQAERTDAAAATLDEQELDRILTRFSRLVGQRYRNEFIRLRRQLPDEHDTLRHAATQERLDAGGFSAFLDILMAVSSFVHALDKVVEHVPEHAPEPHIDTHKKEIETIYRVAGVYAKLYEKRRAAYETLFRKRQFFPAGRKAAFAAIAGVNEKERIVISIITDERNKLRIPSSVPHEYQRHFAILDQYFTGILESQRQFLDLESAYLAGHAPAKELLTAAVGMQETCGEYVRQLIDLDRHSISPTDLARYVSKSPDPAVQGMKTYLIDTPIFVETFVALHATFTGLVGNAPFLEGFQQAHASPGHVLEYIVIANLVAYFNIVGRITTGAASFLETCKRLLAAQTTGT